ncbi:acyl-CoA thioesterase [Rhodococcus sp. NPDC003382]|uniref:acyl-CoA thioesterase n=1 Tax=Rhodococcus sp. HM1 TaxID=2937759 RepID=UPI002009EE02|nr:acyl-CoA thioesterase domain-containing protein [Rhodococcus sp. HM1]MCK8669811.1 thioesterase family protein [Rhodococcus sp. HM1]
MTKACTSRTEVEDRTTLLDILTVENLDRDLFRALPVHHDGRPLFGGQIAAQCLLACGATVPEGREPHSLHGYFLRRGDSSQPVVYRVERDRDGRSYSARRVVALQGGQVLFNMAASFRLRADGAELAGKQPPPMSPPENCRDIPSELPLEVRVDEWPNRTQFFPTRFHVRPIGGLPEKDVLVHAAALTYMSDFSAGLPKHLGGEVLGPSLDHALWFHDVPEWDGWLRVDYEPGAAGGNRGWYSGTIFNAAGRRIASLAQEMVYFDDDPAITAG